MELKHISILGLGLLGGSVGLAAKKYISNCSITGYDLSEPTMQRAKLLGAADHVVSDLTGVVATGGLVVVCVPVGAFGGLVRTLAGALRPGTVVTDVSSTKRSAVTLSESLLPPGVHFVGAHPMSGSERSGIDAASADLFHGARCLLTPTTKTDPAAFATVESFWRLLGMETRSLSPERHDELVAQISHLPHAIASALMTAVSDRAVDLAGSGFADVTRIAAGDGELWRDILRDNVDEVRTSLKRFRAELDRLEAMLDFTRGDELRNWLNAAAARRCKLKIPPDDRT